MRSLSIDRQGKYPKEFVERKLKVTQWPSGKPRSSKTIYSKAHTEQPAGLLIPMTLFKDNISNQSDNDIVAQIPNKLKLDDIAVKSRTTKLCNCPNSEPGKVSSDLRDHESGCHIRKRISTGRFGVNTSVVPQKISDGYGLGVVLGEVDY
jgi:hypothetical protein